MFRAAFEGKVLRQLIEQDQVSSMIFWGPPGVGKTLLAETGAEYLGKKTIVFNMSEYSNPSSITELMGSSKKIFGSGRGAACKVREEKSGWNLDL